MTENLCRVDPDAITEENRNDPAYLAWKKENLEVLVELNKVTELYPNREPPGPPGPETGGKRMAEEDGGETRGADETSYFSSEGRPCQDNIGQQKFQPF